MQNLAFTRSSVHIISTTGIINIFCSNISKFGKRDDGSAGIAVDVGIEFEAANDVAVVVFLDADVAARVGGHRRERRHPRGVTLVAPPRALSSETCKIGIRDEYRICSMGLYQRHCTRLVRQGARMELIWVARNLVNRK